MIKSLLIATWIAIAPNGMREIWISDVAPVPGKEVPANYKVIRAKAGFTEKDLFHVNDDGDVVKPAPPLVPPQPDSRSFQQALFADQEIPPEAKLELLKFFPLIEKHAAEPVYLLPTWAAMVAVYGGSWLTKDVQAKVEAYAEQFHVSIK